jgi:hypothetical protein
MDNALIDQPAPPPTQHRPSSDFSKLLAAAKTNSRWIVIVCVLLGVSGAIRHWRSLQFFNIELQSRESPFPLKEVASVLGTWRALEGTEETLDPEIAKVAGSSDHVIRTYVDDKTGERVKVLLLYGPAQAVWGHTPEVCYPAIGFKSVLNSREIQVPLENSERSAAFREALYGKTRGGTTELREVYYSFLNAGEWRSEMGQQWKRFRYYPGMFKIQVERTVKVAQLGDSPTKDLLAYLVEEIEKRAGTQTPGARSTAVASASTAK